MQAMAVVFSAAKHGNDEREWEDGAASRPADRDAGRPMRVAVADGASAGFSSATWAARLVEGFVGPDQPPLDREHLHRWLEGEQVRWREDPRWDAASAMARRALHTTGSFATLLGCELSGFDGPRPRWDAFALGDTVLFHVRDHRVVTQFPRMAAADFGYNPDGVPTDPAVLTQMITRLDIGGGELAEGDLLFVATDAFAHWIVSDGSRDPRALWSALARLDHPDVFARLVADHRRSGAMHNDDVTLMRIRLTADLPRWLVVCL